MNPISGLLFLFAVAGVILLSGYWLSATNLVDTLAERLAVAAITGLASLLLMLAAVNYFLPLTGMGVGLCLLPAMGTLIWPRCRNQLLADVCGSVRLRIGWMIFALAAIYLAALLSPALVDWQTLFYDGNTNNDSFFWITCGEFLQHHTYQESPVLSNTQPWMNLADDIAGWDPRRGGVGMESLLALFSSLAATAPLQICLYLSAALFLPWCAAVYLAVTTFYRTRLSPAALAALVFLQPIFLFYHASSNLPNLLGAILGATMVLATEQALRATIRSRLVGWCALLALGFHGLLDAYPEMIPFVLLPCGLLWLRPWFARQWAIVRTNASGVTTAFLVGCVVNPAVTVRAWRGFFYSFNTARTADIFGNLFEPLNFAGYVPGFATLAIPTIINLGFGLSLALSCLLLAAAATTWWHARDRWGSLSTLAGSGVLLVYTLVTGFKYGWQKTVQFGGVFITATMIAALLDTLFDPWHRFAGWRRQAARVGLVCILAFYVAATVGSFIQIHDWHQLKTLSRDWMKLRDFSSTNLRDQPVLVEASSFRMAFFHSMWSTYFLTPSRIYIARRGGEGGGYLRHAVLDESAIPGGRPAALLVGRRWAECFDANSPRLLEGREYVLFREANRVTNLRGVYPTNGYPEHASTHFSIELIPHSASHLHLTLTPYQKKVWPGATWRIAHRTGSGLETVQEVTGPPPWQIDVALVPHLSQTIECQVVGPADTSRPWPFAFSRVTIESSP